MAVRWLQFFTIVVCALALIPSGAHLVALPNKIDLPQGDYFIVQGIYQGWAILGMLWPLALLLNGALAYLLRRQRRAFRFAVLATLCYALMLAIFFLWTFPANEATGNWSFAPAEWEELRWQWEASHAVNTLLSLLALCSATASALAWRPQEMDPAEEA